MTSKDEVATAPSTEIEKTWGKLHILVNNAGISGTDAPGLRRVRTNLWDRILATNLNGSYLVTGTRSRS